MYIFEEMCNLRRLLIVQWMPGDEIFKLALSLSYTLSHTRTFSWSTVFKHLKRHLLVIHTFVIWLEMNNTQYSFIKNWLFNINDTKPSTYSFLFYYYSLLCNFHFLCILLNAKVSQWTQKFSNELSYSIQKP